MCIRDRAKKPKESTESSPAATESVSEKTAKKSKKPKAKKSTSPETTEEITEESTESKEKKTKTKKPKEKKSSPSTATSTAASKPVTSIAGVTIPGKTFDLTDVPPSKPAPKMVPEAYKLQTRVDYGTKGTKVDVLTNHILLSVGDDVPQDERASQLDPWWKSAFVYTLSLIHI